jgi:hypothetical protein
MRQSQVQARLWRKRLFLTGGPMSAFEDKVGGRPLFGSNVAHPTILGSFEDLPGAYNAATREGRRPSMNGKRYQVFVSSTYLDLVAERQAVSNALLQMNCIPAGMELFPAASDNQWNLIKRVIDDCDYYLVIVAGRYGSIHRQDVSYTEMEYNYALKAKKPIITFLHSNVSALPPERCEQDTSAQAKLSMFTEKLRKRAPKLWSTPGDLGAAVTASMVNLIREHPTEGLVRPSQTDAVVLRGYANTVAQLEALTRGARYRLWTARTHSGGGANEQSYFEAIAERLSAATGPLEDFRRIIRLNPSAREHLIWLVEHMSHLPNARVYHYEAGGPQFDFVTIDGQTAAIGFAMPGGEGVVGCILLRSTDAVVAVDNVFSELERDCDLLFQGRADIDVAGKEALRRRIDELLAARALRADH